MQERELKYYTLGQQAREEGLESCASSCVFNKVDEAWWLAGYHDKDTELTGRRYFRDR